MFDNRLTLYTVSQEMRVADKTSEQETTQWS